MKVYELLINTLCSNPVFEWDKPYCIHIKCEYLGGKKVRITVPEDCEPECLYVNIKCLDQTCSDCPTSERKKICLCSDAGDCDGCSDCIDNLCVSNCPVDQFCEDDRCVECSDIEPCPQNQICVAGECLCPPNKPFKNSKGVCVSCLNDGDCPPCHICTPEGCVPIDCVEGVCDESTGGCVECLNTGDCDGENECCQGKKCDCCPGFIRDNVSGLCIPAPDCTLDSDCPECHICSSGICTPIQCPEGYICVKGECEPICDCASAKCSEIEACVSLDSGDCYCSPCEGDCTLNTDCGPGCYCKDGECRPKPCKGSCVDGSDCGPGCGCKDGECVPCDSLDCTTSDCSDVLGCGCTSQGCQDIKSCSGDCTTQADCGPGCTCWEGTCTPCADFSCEDCYKHPGCACKDGKCQDSDKDCQDEFKLTIVDDTCDLKAELTTTEGCACSKLTANTFVSKVVTATGGYMLDLGVELRKGGATTLQQAKTLPKLKNVAHQDIAENEAPISGSFAVLVQPFYDEYDINNRKVATNVPGAVANKSASIANSDTVLIKDLFIKTPGTKEGSFLVVTRVEVKVVQSTNLTFPNACVYKGIKPVDSFTINMSSKLGLDKIVGGNNAYKAAFEGFVVLTSDNTRLPLFTWFRSEDGQYSDSEVIRKIYIPKTGNKYIDTLLGPVNPPSGKYPLVPEEGGLRSNKYFAVKNDCSCTKDGDFGKVVFCNPDQLFYVAKNCNTKIEIIEPFSPCSVNELLTKHGVTDPSSQVEYKLYLNGGLVATFVDSQYGMVVKGTTNSMFAEYALGGATITKIELKINHDNQEKCTLTYNLVDESNKDITYTTNCGAAGAYYKLFLPKVGVNYVVNAVSANAGATVTEKSTLFELNVKKGVDTVVTVTFDDGCKKDILVNEDCCEAFDASFERTSTNRDPFLDIDLDILSGSYPFTIRYTGPELDETFVYNNIASLDDAPTPSGPGVTKADQSGLSMSSYLPGTYRVKITDGLGCVVQKVLEIDYIDTPLLVINGYGDFCSGSSTLVNITGDATTAGGNLYYKENGTSKILTLNSLGKATINNVEITTTFVFEKLNVSGYDYTIDETVDIVEIPIPTANISTTNNSICLGDDTDLLITGTVGAVVQISNYGPVTIVEGGTTITVAPEVTTTYKINSAVIENCQSGAGNSVTVTVSPPVTIELVSSICSNDLTTRTMTFSNITSATNQSGSPLVVTGNSVTVDPELVSQVNVVYDAGSCIKMESFTVLSCECPNITYNVTNVGEICDMTPNFTTPVSVVLGAGTYDILVKDEQNNVVYTASSVSALFTVTTLPTLASEDTKLFVKITNHDIPTCFIDNIQITPVVRVLNSPPSESPFFIYGGLCLNEEIGFEPNMSTGGYSFVWTVTRVSNGADVTPVDNEFPSLAFTPAYEDDYEVSVTYSRYGCSKTVNAFITVEACCNLMTVDIVGEETLCENLTAVPSGGQAPYTYLWTGPGISETTAEVDLSGVGSGVTITLTYAVTDAVGCVVTDTVQYTGCECTRALNLLPSYVDGSFDTLNGVASTGTQAQNSNVGASGFTVWTGSPDSWKTPIGVNSPSKIAYQIPAPPVGSGTYPVFVGAYSLTAGSSESFKTTITTVPGSTYVVKFWQANAGYKSGVSDPLPGSSEGKWQVIFGNQNAYSDPEEFLGYGNQVWTLQEISFVANATSTILGFIATKENPAVGVYMAIDGIAVYLDTGSNPCLV